MKQRWFSFHTLQALGQSLMIPVSVLPSAGLVVALGRFLQILSTEAVTKTITQDGAISNAINGVNTTHAKTVSMMITSPWLNSLGKILYSSGLAIFEQLPVVFAIGVAIGFAGGAGVAGLSAAAAYFTLSSLLKVMSDIRGLSLAINTGVFGGILSGLIAAFLYKKYHETRLHPVLGFFSGKRLVPILSVFFALIMGLVLSMVWPPIQSAINNFGTWITGSPLGPAFYAAGKRLLIPVGLHHVYYPSFLFEFGQFVSSTGEILKGDSARYFGGDPSAGLFMASEFPIMLFGLPAAALAMTLRAPTLKRKAVAGIMISAALTSIITGITEPIEFSFIFVAPLLFVLHVVLAFISGLLTHWVDLHLGYTFSASLIDFIVGFYNQKNALQLWLFIGPIIGILYFCSFYFLIPLFDFKTPGRDELDGDSVNSGDGEDIINNERKNNSNNNDKGRILAILSAVGGPQNLIHLDACITRLRLKVRDTQLIQESNLKKLGAAGVMKTSDGSVQIIFGTESDLLKDELKKLIGEVLYFPVMSPLEGSIVPLSQIPDPTFSQGLMGAGVGINPTGHIVRAPFDGVVVSLFHTHHAIGLESAPLPNGKKIELLIHIGIDTVKMKGRGFEALVKQGDFIKKGQELLRFDLDLVKRESPSAITPVIITNMDEFDSFESTDQAISTNTTGAAHTNSAPNSTGSAMILNKDYVLGILTMKKERNKTL